MHTHTHILSFVPPALSQPPHMMSRNERCVHQPRGLWRRRQRRQRRDLMGWAYFQLGQTHTHTQANGRHAAQKLTAAAAGAAATDSEWGGEEAIVVLVFIVFCRRRITISPNTERHERVSCAICHRACMCLFVCGGDGADPVGELALLWTGAKRWLLYVLRQRRISLGPSRTSNLYRDYWRWLAVYTVHTTNKGTRSGILNVASLYIVLFNCFFLICCSTIL